MPENNVTPDSNASLPTLQTKNSSRQWFVAPKPIKQLFDKFPLQTLPSNELPQRTARKRTQHTLYMFTTEDGALRNAPSFNPSCLKWQVCFIPILTLPLEKMLTMSNPRPILNLPPSISVPHLQPIMHLPPGLSLFSYRSLLPPPHHSLSLLPSSKSGHATTN